MDLAKCVLAKFEDLVELFWPNLRIWRSDFGEINGFGEIILAKLGIWRSDLVELSWWLLMNINEM